MLDKSDEYAPWYWLNEESRSFLASGGSYLRNGQSGEDRVKTILAAGEAHVGREGWAEEGLGYVARGFVSFSSPVWSNFAAGRGLPISCYGSFMEDTMKSILEKSAEIGVMSQRGGGTSVYMGRLRPRGAPLSSGGASSGPVHFAQIVQSVVSVVSQSNIRRGNCAMYLDVDHPDIMEFLSSKDEGAPIQHLSFGVCVGSDWIASMRAGDESKRKVWTRILQKRFESGYPYIFFTDNANGPTKPLWYNRSRVHASNLCTEIMLPSTPDESFVCCLSSLNLLHWDEMRKTRVVEWACELLDAVMEEFIQKTDGMWGMEAAHRFAERHRALGLGVLGWHSYLQRHRIPFRSMEARRLNAEIFSEIDARSRHASKEMAGTHGSPAVTTENRWATRLAVAPTQSSSQILGQVSQGIEPLDSNYYTRDLQKGKFTHRNPLLTQILRERGRDTDETWRSVLLHGGSVQHLDFLSDEERDCLRTFGEIPQDEIVVQAAHRQRYIDQGQSVNLKIAPDTPLKDVNALILQAHDMGMKALYYQKSTNPSQAKVRELMTCSACEA